MSKSIIFYELSTKLINPLDEAFFNQNLVEINLPDENDIDLSLSLLIESNLDNKVFENIFIPACFGNVLSDFLGLRLATHIRCTNSPNQLSNIFIYSFASINDYFSSACFNILKTIGVSIIDYNVDEILGRTTFAKSELTIQNLHSEITKLNLALPLNYEDNHSITNEWAIYQWSKTIGANDEAIRKVETTFKNNLYLKYLQTIHPIESGNIIDDKDLKINTAEEATILYIDDEAEKGWKEIFETFFLEKNSNIDFIYHDNELNEKTREEIIDLTLNTIKSENVGIVILDFRIHPKDFESNSIEDVTGYRILKSIKDYNAGIQVILFSATNKIWNMQALQEAGADGFIVKVGPENSSNSDFAKLSIQSFISILQDCINKSFLKFFFSTCNTIEQNIKNSISYPPSSFDDLKKELMVSLKIISESANNINLNLNTSLDVTFLNCYNFLEKFKHSYVREIKYDLVLGYEEMEMKRYNLANNRLVDGGKFTRLSSTDNPTFFHSMIALLIDYFNIVNASDPAIKKVYDVKEARNNYVHKDKANFNVSELVDIITICKTITDNLKE